MRRLGSILLSGVLLGVPRAIECRAFGMRRPVYFEVAPDAGLDGFSGELEAALRDSHWPLARNRAAATTVIEVVGLRRGRLGGRPVETVTVVVREDRRVRRLMLQASPGRHAEAARELLARLAPGDC